MTNLHAENVAVEVDGLAAVAHLEHPVQGAAAQLQRHLLQGVPRLLSQLSEAVISLNVDGIKYHLNHLIPTLGDFV